jgi:hypothetical protein
MSDKKKDKSKFEKLMNMVGIASMEDRAKRMKELAEKERKKRR